MHTVSRKLLQVVLSRVRPLIYYVGAGGSDDNDGLTWATRWVTLAKVAAFTFAMNNRVLLDGTYNETLTLTAARHNGILLGKVGDGATIHGQDTRAYCIDARGCNNLIFQDLTLQDPTNTGLILTGGTHTLSRIISDGSGDQAFQMGGGVTVSNVTVNSCEATNAVDDGFSHHPASGVSTTLTINNTTISGCGEGYQDAGAFAATANFNGVTFSNNTRDISNSTFVTLTTNRSMFKDMAAVGHVAIGGNGNYNYCILDMADATQSTQIGGGLINLNNVTVYGWSGATNRGGITVNSTGIVNMNNVLADRMWRLGYITAGGAINADYCDIYNKTTGDLTTQTNIVGANGNPLLVDPANDDFHIQSTSPCRNSGKTYAGQLTTDYYGNAVASVPSVGAAEYV